MKLTEDDIQLLNSNAFIYDVERYNLVITRKTPNEIKQLKQQILENQEKAEKIQNTFRLEQENKQLKETIKITMWQKLDDKHYRIRFDEPIDSMGNYELIRKQSLEEK